VSAPAAPTIKVWDAFVRFCHWALVLSILGAWLTRHAPGRAHEWIGYASLAIITARIVWGVVGSGHARFRDFLTSPRATWRYTRQVMSRSEPRHVGHNPLGGWMILALLTTVALTGFTGWLYTTDRFWGIEWVEELHSTLADLLLVLAGVHIAGALYASFRHRENLIGAMFHGRKRADVAVDRNRRSP